LNGNFTFAVESNGTIRWGADSSHADMDVALYRNASSTLRTNSNFIIDGNVGIGTTSPATNLEVGGSTANVTLDGYLNCSGFTSNANGLLACTASDQRLKQAVVPLDASSTLAALNALNPVSFYWKPGTDRGTQQQYGLIAQQVAGVFPDLVSTSSPTVLTPDGTLTVNYDGLIAPIVVVIQKLAREMSGFAQSITTVVLNATTLNSQQDNTQRLCVGDTCITGPQLQELLQNSAQQGGAPQTSPIIITDTPSPTGDVTITATGTDPSATTTAPNSSASASSTPPNDGAPPAPDNTATSTSS